MYVSDLKTKPKIVTASFVPGCRTFSFQFFWFLISFDIFILPAAGVIPSPFDCYLVTRSLKTLKVRMKEHMNSGLRVARFLESHPAVEQVLYPGKILYAYICDFFSSISHLSPNSCSSFLFLSLLHVFSY